jgi:hypothetical protein
MSKVATAAMLGVAGGIGLTVGLMEWAGKDEAATQSTETTVSLEASPTTTALGNVATTTVVAAPPARVNIPGTNLMCDPTPIEITLSGPNEENGTISWLRGLDDFYGGTPNLDLTRDQAFAVVYHSAGLSGIVVGDPDNVPVGKYKTFAHCSDGHTNW